MRLIAVGDDPINKQEELMTVESIEQPVDNQVENDPKELVEQAFSFLNSFEEILSQLETAIGYEFRDRALLRRALTHRSFANEQPDPRPLHNEALEFLGDAVLEFLISSWLLELHPSHTEGTLSKMRAYAVSAVNLRKHAARLQLGSYLLLNRGEEKTGGRSKTALQVDAYEALIAAIYLDGGIESAKDFVRREFAATFTEIDPQNLTSTDYKTALQERLQSYGLPTPQYAIVESLGPDHRRIFQVELRVNGYCLATGEGTTIKGAHQTAARAAINNLETELDKLKEIQTIIEPPQIIESSPAEPGLTELPFTEETVETEQPEITEQTK
jgi:ribonuclease-3